MTRSPAFLEAPDIDPKAIHRRAHRPAYEGISQLVTRLIEIPRRVRLVPARMPLLGREKMIGTGFSYSAGAKNSPG